MGKSTSCFKIIACGGDSREKDDNHISESKRLNDKQGWSFRKRSSRQRVLSNTVIAEISSPGNRESFNNFQQPTNGCTLEKDAGLQCATEKPQLPSTENLKESEAVDVIQKESKVEIELEERSAIIIQSVIRGLLARRKLLMLKNVVKLQAAIRGHLVRKHAIETLRCIQAIIKMQALVRARCARLSVERSHTKDSHSYKTLEKEKLRKSSGTYVSIEKLLSNSFARQLLESTPTTRPINVSYYCSKSETTWKWLERWTSISSVDVLELKEAEFMTGEQGKEKEENVHASEASAEIDSNVLCKSADSRSSNEESVVHSESEDNLITYDMDNTEFQPCQVTSSMLEKTWFEDAGVSNVKETLMEANSLPDQRMRLVADSQLQYNPHKEDLGTEFQQNKTSTGTFSSDQLELKEKKTIFGSRRASNPAFIAAQSKFQELSSMETSGRSISSSYQEEAESCIVAISSASATALKTDEVSTTEDFITNGPRTIRAGGSECGTELSITSTLDSPDLSEACAFEYERETNVTEICVHDQSSNKSTEIDVGSAPSSQVSNLFQPVLGSPEKPGVVESIDKITVDSAKNEVKPDVNASVLQGEQDIETGNCRLSPSASPRSHITILESQGTPSSQVSTKSNKRKTDMSRSNPKRKSLTAGKKSPSKLHRNVDSPNNSEPFPKDKIEKRRNSFSSARPDHVEEESRESSSNQSLPHFMRATESARAKVQLNNSPRSSPDVQDEEIYIKKRHSFPVANGRQGSPRIQRTTSQAQKSGKGNERKWQR
ncbi:protein IQ-DOMAIN 32-like isoform X1 [Cucurbita moschata]|uniref:Protein IQ-DOMAIN 32-like isoform X1 n=1 Tax=Cucurbita moschata TaxID=3662 RepID=A0A6J1FQA7_CUCMO|nr:protein IQ-DOMAIN 32-like isoform X1 [Cucurbita moschata]